MKKNDNELVLMIGDRVVSITKGYSIPVNYESKDTPEWIDLMKKTKYWSCEIDNTKKCIMSYYYHRGKKYFFRNEGAKIIMECDELPVRLKYGTEINMEFTTEL